MPHLALPVLTGFMRRHGYDVVQRDLNVEVFNKILTRHYLTEMVELVRSRFGPDARRRQRPHGVPPPEQVRWAIEQGGRIAAQVDAARQMMTSPAFFDGETSQGAFFTISEALELASLPYYPARLELTTFIDAGRPDVSADLLEAVRSPYINPFYDLFRRGVLKDIQRDKPDLVGISVPTQAQFLAALTLAALIRDAGLTCHITLGGPHVTMLRERLAEVPRLFDLIDSVVLFDGEVPLLHLAEALESGSGLENVPNLVYRLPGDSGAVRTNPQLAAPDARAIEVEQQPDFDGLPLDSYLAPELVLPLETAHGCYYGKCAFCNVGYGGENGYFPIPVNHIVDQIKFLRDKYGCRSIFFVDEAMTPRTMRLLSAALKASTPAGSPINWAVAARLEKTLSAELLTEAAASGCRMLLYGLESASQPVMQSMIKGTLVDEMARILQTSAPLGIWNHTFFFFGFPGETIEDAQATVNFIYAHQDVIHSASPGAFLLEVYSPAQREPQKFGIVDFWNPPEKDLAIYYEYRLSAGMDEVTANTLADGFINQLPDKRYGQFYMNDVVRFLYACELGRRGEPLPRWIE